MYYGILNTSVSKAYSKFNDFYDNEFYLVARLLSSTEKKYQIQYLLFGDYSFETFEVEVLKENLNQVCSRPLNNNSIFIFSIDKDEIEEIINDNDYMPPDPNLDKGLKGFQYVRFDRTAQFIDDCANQYVKEKLNILLGNTGEKLPYLFKKRTAQNLLALGFPMEGALFTQNGKNVNFLTILDNEDVTHLLVSQNGWNNFISSEEVIATIGVFDAYAPKDDGAIEFNGGKNQPENLIGIPYEDNYISFQINSFNEQHRLDSKTTPHLQESQEKTKVTLH